MDQWCRRVGRDEGEPLSSKVLYLCLANHPLTCRHLPAWGIDSLQMDDVVFQRYGTDYTLHRDGSHRNLCNRGEPLQGQLPSTSKNCRSRSHSPIGMDKKERSTCPSPYRLTARRERWDRLGGGDALAIRLPSKEWIPLPCAATCLASPPCNRSLRTGITEPRWNCWEIGWYQGPRPLTKRADYNQVRP